MEELYAFRKIRTFTGKYVDIFDPKPEMFCIQDIAHSLSFQCRFSGHLPKFYSVCQHSIECFNMASKENKLEALLHDATEAYMLDIPKPIKEHLPDYKEMENRLAMVLASVFGFQYPFPAEIKFIDETMLVKEWYSIMQGTGAPMSILPMDDAKDKFLEIYNQIKRV